MKPSELLQLIQDYADTWYALGRTNPVETGPVESTRNLLNDKIAKLWQQIRKGVRDEETSGNIFEHPFFLKAPAMAALQKEQNPSSGHVRACLLELARYILRDAGR